MIPDSRFLAIMAVIAVSLFHAGCQTVKPSFQKVHLPIKLMEQFGSCQGDGATAVALLENAIVVESFEVDWIVRRDRSWVVQAGNPFGGKIFDLRFDNPNKRIQFEGPVQLQDTMTADESGFLVVDGHQVKIKLIEIPCLLRGKFPRVWLEKVSKVSKEDTQTRYDIWDAERQIFLATKVQEDAVAICSEISWSSYLGLVRHRARICKSEGQMTISGYENWQVKLEYLEDL